MKDKKAIKAAKYLRKYCKKHIKCVGCCMHIEHHGCVFARGNPESWIFDKEDKKC